MLASDNIVPLNLPNILTLLRVAAIPLLVAFCYLGSKYATLWATGLFLLAAVTDWLDGWLARRSGQTTAFGAFLDPVADKLIVATALVLLTERFDNPVITVSACVIVGREIVVSALREWMAQIGQHAHVRVSTIGKVKTAVQMVAITLLLAQMPGVGYPLWFWLAQGLLLLAVVLTLWSMFLYLRAFMRVVGEGVL